MARSADSNSSERRDTVESEAVAKIIEIYGADRSELRSFENALRQAYRSGHARAQPPAAPRPDLAARLLPLVEPAKARLLDEVGNPDTDAIIGDVLPMLRQMLEILREPSARADPRHVAACHRCKGTGHDPVEDARCSWCDATGMESEPPGAKDPLLLILEELRGLREPSAEDGKTEATPNDATWEDLHALQLGSILEELRGMRGDAREREICRRRELFHERETVKGGS